MLARAMSTTSGISLRVWGWGGGAGSGRGQGSRSGLAGVAGLEQSPEGI